MTKSEQIAEAMGYTVDKSGGGRIFIIFRLANRFLSRRRFNAKRAKRLI